MPELILRPAFRAWLDGLRDTRARNAVARRLDRLAFGHEGDASDVGEGVRELRIHLGPGFRVYYVPRGEAVIVVLRGGDKDTQRRDIPAAIADADALEDR